MQLQNIDIRKLDYNPNPLKFSANPREKQANRLSMYGFETHRTKSAKQNDHRVKVSNKDKEMTNDNVSVLCLVYIFFASHIVSIEYLCGL